MNPKPATVPATISLQQLVDVYFLPAGLRFALVCQCKRYPAHVQLWGNDELTELFRVKYALRELIEKTHQLIVAPKVGISCFMIQSTCWNAIRIGSTPVHSEHQRVHSSRRKERRPEEVGPGVRLFAYRGVA
jgi:hypothetical protein